MGIENRDKTTTERNDSREGGMITFAETVMAGEGFTSWANLGATGIIGALLVWIITKAFPTMLERHDKVQEETRQHFERILTNVDTSRALSAHEGHEAAKELSKSIERSSECVRQNTSAVEKLTNKFGAVN